MWKIPSGDCKTFQSHGVPATCGKVIHDGKLVIILVSKHRPSDSLTTGLSHCWQLTDMFLVF